MDNKNGTSQSYKSSSLKLEKKQPNEANGSLQLLKRNRATSVTRKRASKTFSSSRHTLKLQSQSSVGLEHRALPRRSSKTMQGADQAWNYDDNAPRFQPRVLNVGRSDWNSLFHLALDLPESTSNEILRKYQRLTQLSADFVATASMIGKLIITEFFLPVEDRIIKPTKLGGIAGGIKFLVRGIVFKLAVDPFVNETKCFLYGKQRPNDECAMKAAGHDLKGSSNYFRFFNSPASFSQSTPTQVKVRVPMQVLVDHRGFRLACMPYLPLHSNKVPDSGVSSSHLGGRGPSITISNSTSRVPDELTFDAQKRLQLKEAQCQELQQQIFSLTQKNHELAFAIETWALTHTLSQQTVSKRLESSLSARLDPETPSNLSSQFAAYGAISNQIHQMQNIQVGRSDPLAEACFTPSHTKANEHPNEHPHAKHTVYHRDGPSKPKSPSPPVFSALPPSVGVAVTAGSSPTLGIAVNYEQLRQASSESQTTHYTQTFPPLLADSPPTLTMANPGVDRLDSDPPAWVCRDKDNYNTDPLHSLHDPSAGNWQAGLIYGCDGRQGLEVHDTDPVFRRVMQEAARALHLKAHGVGPHTLYAAGDVEGHRGRDGYYYLLDLARAFPPEAPVVCSHLAVRAAKQNTVLFHLLRPEFLQRLKADGLPALSPDAFTGWGADDAKCKEHDEEVERASLLLMGEHLPRFARELTQLPLDQLEKLNLAEEVHRRGLNLRHIGVVRSLIPAPAWVENPSAEARAAASARQLLLVDVVARTLKNLLRERLRHILLTEDAGSDLAFRRRVADFLNLVSGAHTRSDEFWRVAVPPEVELRFGACALLPLETPRLFGLVRGQLIRIVRAVLAATGLRLVPSCEAAFERETRSYARFTQNHSKSNNDGLMFSPTRADERFGDSPAPDPLEAQRAQRYAHLMADSFCAGAAFAGDVLRLAQQLEAIGKPSSDKNNNGPLTTIASASRVNSPANHHEHEVDEQLQHRSGMNPPNSTTTTLTATGWQAFRARFTAPDHTDRRAAPKGAGGSRAETHEAGEAIGGLASSDLRVRYTEALARFESLAEPVSCLRGFEFSAGDVLVEARVKHMSIVDYAEGRVLAQQGAHTGTSLHAAVRLLELAASRFESALKSDPLHAAAFDSLTVMRFLGDAFRAELASNSERADTVLLSALFLHAQPHSNDSDNEQEDDDRESSPWAPPDSFQALYEAELLRQSSLQAAELDAGQDLFAADAFVEPTPTPDVFSSPLSGAKMGSGGDVGATSTSNMNTRTRSASDSREGVGSKEGSTKPEPSKPGPAHAHTHTTRGDNTERPRSPRSPADPMSPPQGSGKQGELSPKHVHSSQTTGTTTRARAESSSRSTPTPAADLASMRVRSPSSELNLLSTSSSLDGNGYVVGSGVGGVGEWSGGSGRLGRMRSPSTGTANGNGGDERRGTGISQALDFNRDLGVGVGVGVGVGAGAGADSVGNNHNQSVDLLRVHGDEDDDDAGDASGDGFLEPTELPGRALSMQRDRGRSQSRNSISDGGGQLLESSGAGRRGSYSFSSKGHTPAPALLLQRAHSLDPASRAASTEGVGGHATGLVAESQMRAALPFIAIELVRGQFRLWLHRMDGDLQARADPATLRAVYALVNRSAHKGLMRQARLVAYRNAVAVIVGSEHKYLRRLRALVLDFLLPLLKWLDQGSAATTHNANTKPNFPAQSSPEAAVTRKPTFFASFIGGHRERASDKNAPLPAVLAREKTKPGDKELKQMALKDTPALGPGDKALAGHVAAVSALTALVQRLFSFHEKLYAAFRRVPTAGNSSDHLVFCDVGAVLLNYASELPLYLRYMRVLAAVSSRIETLQTNEACRAFLAGRRAELLEEAQARGDRARDWLPEGALANPPDLLSFVRLPLSRLPLYFNALVCMQDALEGWLTLSSPSHNWTTGTHLSSDTVASPTESLAEPQSEPQACFPDELAHSPTPSLPTSPSLPAQASWEVSKDKFQVLDMPLNLPPVLRGARSGETHPGQIS